MMATDRHLVVVSRKWHEPFIRVSVTDLDIKVVMTLDDFTQAAAAEAGVDPARLSAVFEKVVSAMKAETAKVM